MDPQERLAAALFLSGYFASRRIKYEALRPLAGRLFDTLLQEGRARRADRQAETEEENDVRMHLKRLFAQERTAWLVAAKAARAEGIFVFEPTPGQWQRRLYAVSAMPPFLYARGRAEAIGKLEGAAVAVVGSRQPDRYGLAATARLVAELAAAGMTIVSGGARGIDRAAHEAALHADGSTVAVLGHGVDLVYPAQNRELFARIADRGFLLSEYPPGTPPRRHHFPARNRLVTALSDCLIVTAARENSGTLITAGFAADQGKPVFAVPGSILSDAAESCHRLIKEGANLYTGIADLRAIYPDLLARRSNRSDP